MPWTQSDAANERLAHEDAALVGVLAVWLYDLEVVRLDERTFRLS